MDLRLSRYLSKLRLRDTLSFLIVPEEPALPVSLQSKVFMWNSPIEALERSDLEKLQLGRLKQIIERTYARVPFYKKLLDDAGCNPGQINKLSDLQRLPFMRKQDLRDNYPFGLFSVPMAQVNRIHASSGTKGKPTVVGYTKNDIDVWSEVVARSLAAANVRPGDVLHNSYGYGLFTGGLGLHYGAEALGATVVPASGGRTNQQIMLLKDFQARVICSTPSYALNISYALEELGVKRSDLNLQIGIFGAEPWTEEMRVQLQDRLQIEALDIYGLSEVMGPGVSMECASGRNGLHIWEDHFLAEIIDPESGEPLPYGQEGELVFTTLTKEAIPMVRYRTGDLSMLMPDKCICGRTMVRMQRIRARIDDMLIVRGVNVFPSEIEAVLLQVDGLAPNYQLIVDREKALDRLEVQVEVSDKQITVWGAFDHGHAEVKELHLRIENSLKDTLGLTAEITLLKPNSLGRSEGKAVRVIDKRGAADAATANDKSKRG